MYIQSSFAEDFSNKGKHIMQINKREIKVRKEKEKMKKGVDGDWKLIKKPRLGGRRKAQKKEMMEREV